MANPSDLEAGDFIRISRLYVKDTGKYVRGVMWAVVGEDVDEVVVPIEVFHGPADSLDENEFDGGDAGRRYSVDTVPGYALALFTKWQLTGEKTIATS